MRSIGLEPTEEEVRERIASVDRSGSGSIEFPEFREMMNGLLAPAAPAAEPASRELEWTRGHTVELRERAGAVKGEWALCVVTPTDPHNNWGLSLFKKNRTGPDLFAVVCVPRAPDPAQTRARARHVHARGGALNEMLTAGVLDVQHAGDEGRLNARKMIAGAPVAVRFEFKSSVAYKHIWFERILNVLVPFVLNTLGNALMAYLKSSFRFNVKPLKPVMGAAVLETNANIAQAHGFLRQHDTDFCYMEVPRASENAVFSYDNDEVARYLGQTDAAADMPYGAHYLQVRRDRVVAHARFRTALLTDSLEELRWIIALVWPGPIALSDVVLVDNSKRAGGPGVVAGCLPASGSVLSGSVLAEGYGVAKLLKGEVEVRVFGIPVAFIDAR